MVCVCEGLWATAFAGSCTLMGAGVAVLVMPPGGSSPRGGPCPQGVHVPPGGACPKRGSAALKLSLPLSGSLTFPIPSVCLTVCLCAWARYVARGVDPPTSVVIGGHRPCNTQPCRCPILKFVCCGLASLVLASHHLQRSATSALLSRSLMSGHVRTHACGHFAPHSLLISFPRT